LIDFKGAIYVNYSHPSVIDELTLFRIFALNLLIHETDLKWKILFTPYLCGEIIISLHLHIPINKITNPMKAFTKKLFFPLLAGIFLLNSSFHTANNFTQGVFKTSDDYVQKHLTLYDEIHLGPHGYKGTLNGKKVSGLYNKADFWGIQTEDGMAYRINTKYNIADHIIGKGSICFYAGQELVMELFEDGRLKSQYVNAEKGTKFSEVFWVSNGLDGEMLGASVDNLSKLFADSPDLVNKVQKTGIDEKNIKAWLDIFATVNGWIGEYNKGHK